MLFGLGPFTPLLVLLRLFLPTAMGFSAVMLATHAGHFDKACAKENMGAVVKGFNLLAVTKVFFSALNLFLRRNNALVHNVFMPRFMFDGILCLFQAVVVTAASAIIET